MDLAQDRALTQGIPAGRRNRDAMRWLARADMFRFLGRCFDYPTEGDLDDLTHVGRSLAAGPHLHERIRSLVVNVCEEASTRDLQTEQCEYERIFDVAPVCPPYESAFCPALKERVLCDIAGFYTAFGLTPSARRAERPDHICAELEFLSVVSVKLALATSEGRLEAREVCEHAYRSFLGDHLGRWAQPFCEEVAAASNSRLVGSSTSLLAHWTAHELRVHRVRTDPYTAPGVLPPEAEISCGMSAQPPQG
ncbi:MAG: molecular chaperone TorD family protein [Nitrospirae bacterium]|nr:molecular chaperone TorD family protein [Nitrospirota bacterium]